MGEVLTLPVRKAAPAAVVALDPLEEALAEALYLDEAGPGYPSWADLVASDEFPDVVRRHRETASFLAVVVRREAEAGNV